MHCELIDILMVEDNPGDARLAQEALKESKVYNTITWVNSGDKALDFLYGRGAYNNRKLPDLILLDLNLPGKDGRDVLAEIKSSPTLKHIPVVILTSSEAEEDIVKSYNLHANCYVSKPIDFGEFEKVVKNIDSFWLSIVRLPKGGDDEVCHS